MKNLFLSVVLISLLNQTQASHIAGAELQYQCVGNGQFLITYVFYRDCFGIPALPTVTCIINNSCGYPVTTITLDRMSNSPVQIIPNCGDSTTCNGGTMPGIEKWFYTGVVTLPAECFSWTLSVSQSARNAAITTVPDPFYADLYVIANLNNSNNLCDTSPVFTEDPVMFACLNQPYCLNPGIFDAEGDSIVCSFMQPLTGLNQPIPYDTGYSATQPIQSNPPVSMDPVTGQICFYPTQPDVTFYAMLVNSYRNGILIGSVERDIELYAGNCSNAQPDVSGINGTGNFDTTVCVYSSLCFDIYSGDPDPSDSTFVTTDAIIPSSTFSVNPGQNESASFCWTPGPNDISSTPVCFTVRVRDNSCPARLVNARQYCITVVDSFDCLTLKANDAISVNDDLKIYPQPINDHFVVDRGNSKVEGKIFLNIENVIGKQIFRLPFNDRIINLSGFLPGIYVGYLSDEKGVVTKKVKFVVL